MICTLKMARTCMVNVAAIPAVASVNPTMFTVPSYAVDCEAQVREGIICKVVWYTGAE